MAPIFQIIDIQNKTLNSYVSGVFERRRKVQTRLRGPFTFWRKRQREKKPQERGCIRSEVDERKLV